MYGIFTQGIDGMNWCAMADTVEEAQEVAKDYEGREGVDFTIIVPGVIVGPTGAE